jgi:hypothetical protein
MTNKIAIVTGGSHGLGRVPPPGIRHRARPIEVPVFSLDQVNEAVTRAARQAGIFKVTVVQP